MLLFFVCFICLLFLLVCFSALISYSPIIPYSSFHGHGTLHFTTGGKFECEWVCGHPAGEEGIGGQYTFKDGLEHQEQDWKYCNMADRRFYSEICKGIKPAGAKCSHLNVNMKPTPHPPRAHPAD